MLARDCCSTCLHRSGLRRIAPPTMPSADFCAAVRTPYDDLSLVTETQHRPPEVRPTAFTARPPDLPPRPLMTVDFAITCSLVRPGRPRYPVLVHRAAALLHASFRPHLAMTPLRFANPSPPSGWIEDFHLQAVVHARHTSQWPGHARPSKLTRYSGAAISISLAPDSERFLHRAVGDREQHRFFRRIVRVARPRRRDKYVVRPPFEYFVANFG